VPSAARFSASLRDTVFSTPSSIHTTIGANSRSTSPRRPPKKESPLPTHKRRPADTARDNFSATPNALRWSASEFPGGPSFLVLKRWGNYPVHFELVLFFASVYVVISSEALRLLRRRRRNFFDLPKRSEGSVFDVPRPISIPPNSRRCLSSGHGFFSRAPIKRRPPYLLLRGLLAQALGHFNYPRPHRATNLLCLIFCYRPFLRLIASQSPCRPRSQNPLRFPPPPIYNPKFRSHVANN
jgi:hypothetical protein